MDIRIVYSSLTGNTKQIAEHIGHTLSKQIPALLVRFKKQDLKREIFCW